MKFFFVCPEHGVNQPGGFDHQIIVLAEGLRQLGVSYGANSNYWRTSLSDNDYLITKNEKIDIDNSDVVIFSQKMIDDIGIHSIEPILKRKNKQILVFIDGADGLITPGCDLSSKVDIVLKCHYNSKFQYPRNFYPWQFGLSSRIIQQTNPRVGDNRSEKVLVNYRVKHALRKKANSALQPIVSKYYEIDKTIDVRFDNQTKIENLDQLFDAQSHRHNPSYYNRLRQCLGCFCFGGFLTNRYLMKDSLAQKVLRRVNYDIELVKNDRVFQWDSWRLWEAMSAGAVMLHLDFEKYGMKLPINPVNGVHYVGIDLDDLKSFERTVSDINTIKEIAECGRHWALDNYSPEAIARRFLALIEGHHPSF